MRICLIAEGCYPYVAGGVSSWIQMLIQGMPQHEFVIYTIGAEEKLRGIYKYELPSNVVEINEHFLDEFFNNKIVVNKNYKLNANQKKEICNLAGGGDVNWAVLFDMFKKEGKFKANEFLVSRAFLDIIMELCEGRYRQLSFNEVFWTIRSMLLPILNLLKSETPQADLYHSVSTGYAGIMGAKFKYDTKKPYIVTEHGIYTREREEEILKADWVVNYFKETWIDFFMTLSLGSYLVGDKITSLFLTAKQKQVELGASDHRCIVIPNGIELSRFRNISEIDITKSELTIGAIVRVVPIKDIKTMIHSFELVRKELPQAKLYIIGPYEEAPEYYQECLELIEILHCGGIEFTGRVDIDKWMQKLDVILLTSVSEGQPFVLLEAMAAGRPVVSTDVGSCREIIEGPLDEYGDGGFVVPVMNPNMIARAILKFSNDRSLMVKMGQEGYKRVQKYYRIEGFLEKYKKLYRSVLEEWQG